jgi:hypothetical protein
VQARNLYLKGLAAEAEGRKTEALEAFIESARRSARFTSSYAHALTIAMRDFKANPAAAQALLRRLAAARPDRPTAVELQKRLFPGSD